jgi:formylmethanofuran dehydrogenase subunit C
MLVLRVLPHGTIPLEAECLRPDFLQTQHVADIARLPVWHGNRENRLGDHFEITGDAADGIVEIQGDASRVKRLGEGMASGVLRVHGNCGMHAGAHMTGGRLEILGNAGDWLGAQMQGGCIHVHGNAGDLVGAAVRGASRGMTGGSIFIYGQAGDEIAAGMRRGTIAIAGAAGDYLGVHMIAGTVIVGGRAGVACGAGMKRGTLVVGNLIEKPIGFALCRMFQPQFLALYANHLKHHAFPVPWDSQRLWARYSGDTASAGQGEILLPAAVG